MPKSALLVKGFFIIKTSYAVDTVGCVLKDE